MKPLTPRSLAPALVLAAALVAGLLLAPATGIAGSEGVTIQVKIESAGGGSGTVTGPGINCPGDCEETVPRDTPVPLTGTPAADSELQWSGVCEGFNPDEACSLNGSADALAVAIFTRKGGDGGGGGPAAAEITKAPKKVKTKKKKAKVTFEFAAAGAAGFECRLDDKPFKACESPATLKAKRGRHTFEVRAIDAAGSAGAADSRSFKVKRKRRG